MKHVHAARAPRKGSAHVLSCSEEHAERAARCLAMAEEALRTNHPGLACVVLDAARSYAGHVRHEALRAMLLAEIEMLTLESALTADAPPLTAAAWAHRALLVADEALAKGDTARAGLALRTSVRVLQGVSVAKRKPLLEQALRLAVWMAETQNGRWAA